MTPKAAGGIVLTWCKDNDAERVGCKMISNVRCNRLASGIDRQGLEEGFPSTMPEVFFEKVHLMSFLTPHQVLSSAISTQFAVPVGFSIVASGCGALSCD